MIADGHRIVDEATGDRCSDIGMELEGNATVIRLAVWLDG